MSSKWPKYFPGVQGGNIKVARVNPYEGNVAVDSSYRGNVALVKPSVARRMARALLKAADEADLERKASQR